MTRLVEALEGLDLEGEVSLSGRWVKLRGERCPAYIVEVARGTQYYTWCDAPGSCSIELYHDATAAIRAALRNAAASPEQQNDEV